MTRADWVLLIQAVASVSAAVAAVFAWLTARAVKKDKENDRRHRASEHLKTILRLISELVDVAHRDVTQTFAVQMRLRAELGVTYVPLPKCIELVDPAHGRTFTIPELDTLAPAALAEVEAAQQTVWEGHIEGVLYGPRGAAEPAAPE